MILKKGRDSDTDRKRRNGGIRMRWSKAFRWITGFLILFLFIAASYAFYQSQRLFDRVYDRASENRQIHLIREEVEEIPIGVGEAIGKKERKKAPAMRPFTLLILGVDSRGELRARSDTMMVAVVNPKRKRITLLSIPRDTRVKIGRYGYEKLNHAMFIGGVPMVEKTLEDFLGISIDRYVAVDFEGFRRIVDTIGGVEVEVKKRMKYHDPTDGTLIHLNPGRQMLRGKEALDYARYRKSDIARDDSDFERIARQQEVIRAAAAKLEKDMTVGRLLTLMEIIGSHVKTDFTKDELKKLMGYYLENRMGEINSITLTGSDRLLPYKGRILYFFSVDEKERERVRRLLLESLSESLPGSGIPQKTADWISR